MTVELHVTIAKFLWGIPDSFFVPFREHTEVSTPLSLIANSFQKNLKAAIQVGSIPFTLANAAVHQQHWQRIFSAESIRDLIPDETRPPGNAGDRAIAKMRLDDVDKAMIDLRAKQTVSFVQAVTSDEDAGEASEELLRQVLVVIWGAFEVLVNDVVVETLNTAPQFVERLKQAQRYKVTNVSVDKLSNHNYDLSKKMGSVIFEDQRLDTIKLMEEVCELLFNKESLSKSLKNQELWNLAQKRNLIVHRRGIVDSQYLSKTPYDAPLGSTLLSSGKEVEMFLCVVRDIGLDLLQSANETLRNS